MQSEDEDDHVLVQRIFLVGYSRMVCSSTLIV